MGAAATVRKEDVETTSATRSQSMFDISRKSASMPVVCTACKTTLGIFKRKKCACCTQIHCTRCLMPRTGNYDGRPACNKCAVLANGDYTRDFLAAHYTLRELRAFLSRRRVNIDGCTEKNDVIEVLMQMRRTSAAHNEEEEHRRHILQLKERMSRDFVNGTQPSASTSAEEASSGGYVRSSPSPPSPPEVATNRTSDFIQNIPTPSSSMSFGSGGGGGVQRTVPMAATTSPGQGGDTDDRSNPIPTEPETLNEPNNQDNASSSNTCPPPMPDDTPSVSRRITLDDIGSKEDVNSLTVRQLKDLLVNNYVDYKGCCERQELVNRVQDLWSDKMRMRKAAADGSEFPVPDDDLCKVCMDAAIDCLLLECGHMVTCTKCGKQLAECPICRRYVSRVVHVFRA